MTSPAIQSTVEAPRPIPVPDVASSLQLLLVEDDTDLREPLATLLRHEGHTVRTFANGIELTRYLGSWILRSAAPPSRHVVPIDAIVTDIRMPGFNGLGIIQGLRAKGWTVPVVVMTAFADERVRERIERMDDVVLLEKPFEPEVLARTIGMLCRSPMTHPPSSEDFADPVESAAQ